MELKAENVKNIRSLAVCKELLRQAIEQNDKLKEERDWLAKDRAQAYNDLEKRAQLNIKQEESNRHSKYKRCLAMAEWCDAEADVADADGDYDDMRWYQKWHERWLKLAKQFKED